MEGQSAAPVRGMYGACGWYAFDAVRSVLRLRDLTPSGRFRPS